MNQKDFEARGYKRFERSVFDSPGVLYHMQKRFDDEVGKKYFITVNIWSPFEGMSERNLIEYEVCLRDKETDCPVRIAFYAGWTVEQVEARAEEMFGTDAWRYYERWEED